MKLKTLLLGVVWLCHCPAFTQSKVQRLSPGSSTPDVKLKVYIDDKPRYIKLRDLKNKLVIINYWSQERDICLSSMPKLDSLQKVFGDSLSIILVTTEDKPAVDDLFKQISISRPNLMMVYGDTLLKKYFPHNSVPHHIWLEPRGSIRYITAGYNTTGNNIRRFLWNNDLDLRYKNEEQDFDPTSPLLSIDNGDLINKVVRYSTLFKRIPQTEQGSYRFILDSARNQFGIKMINVPILMLYQFAFNEVLLGGKFEADNKVKLEVSRPERFRDPESDEVRDAWKANNTYTYELRMPGVKLQDCFEQLRTDLRLSLPYIAEVKTVPTTSYVLVKFGNADLLATKFSNSPAESGGLHLKNESFQSLVDQLRNLCNNYKHPLAVEYQYEGNIDFDWPEFAPGYAFTAEDLRPYLQKRGLDLVIKEAPQEMLVIRDK